MKSTTADPAGLYGVVCFQETYNRKNLQHLPPGGHGVEVRVARERLSTAWGEAGSAKIGMGVLIGLEEWRTDVTMMALHLQYLRRRYWKTRYNVNFPRIPLRGSFLAPTW